MYSKLVHVISLLSMNPFNLHITKKNSGEVNNKCLPLIKRNKIESADYTIYMIFN